MKPLMSKSQQMKYIFVTLIVFSTALEANGDGDKKHQNESLTKHQEPSLSVPLSNQTDMNPLALDHAEYETVHENTETGMEKVLAHS